MKHGQRWIALAAALVLVLTVCGALWAQEAAKINVNKASVEELTQLKRIGAKYAEKIVSFREQYGPFKTPEDLLKVQGIGPKTLESNRDRITFE